ncbi:hypothetical protein G7046_g2503 [Stylonectria norvegica]|nr:hypothetical protein G7046_g2503 [Stylonectria norvegica]
MSRQVFAHYMVGLTDGQALDQWTKDVNDAKNVGIDGFALNIGPDDDWTLTQLHQAYAAAEAAGFTLFISFDMNPPYVWDPQQVTDLINTFKSSSAQVKVDGKPMVSTFEGPTWSDNWAGVRSSTGGIYLVPAWTSLGPSGVQGKLGLIDGAFSWSSWPQPGQTKMTDSEDLAYKNILGSKPYMMGVSPYFYTNLPQWNKNWYSSSESLWYDRWQQVLDVLPQFVEIITWNDYGESHYIGDTDSAQIVSGAEKYVNGHDHSAFRAVLPYFIKAFKAGDRNVDLPSPGETAMAWYRENPKALGSDGGTVWGQGGSASARDGASDVVSVIAITIDDTEVLISIGGDTQSFWTNSTAGRASFFEMPYNGRTGAVSLSMNGQTTVGASITNNLPSTGYVNFNSLAIRL